MRPLLAEETGFEPARALLYTQRVSNPPQWTSYATPPNFGFLLYHRKLAVCYTDAMGVLDIFFPKQCIGCKKLGSYVCIACFSTIQFSDTGICAVCNHPAMFGKTHPICRKRHTVDGMNASLRYSGIVKKLLYKFKYPPYVTDLQTSLSVLFYEGIIQKEGVMHFVETKPYVVPIPLHKTKLRSRGYNQAELLSREIAKRLSLPRAQILIRQKQTTTQVGLSREERLQNLKDAFKITDTTALNGKHVLLVDDVMTTGATFLEAAKTLKKAGVKEVWGIALAHGQ
jgi:competence protein ComFC